MSGILPDTPRWAGKMGICRHFCEFIDASYQISPVRGLKQGFGHILWTSRCFLPNALTEISDTKTNEPVVIN